MYSGRLFFRSDTPLNPPERVAAGSVYDCEARARAPAPHQQPVSGSSLEVLQHFFGVAFGFDLGEDVRDAAVGTYDESSAFDAHHFLAIHILFFHDSEGIRDFL